VASFPGSVEVRPGEGAVLMLKVKTCGAPAGRCIVAVKAGNARRELSLRVVDAVLPESSAWIFAWGQFTRQFPFESLSRVARDARQLRELGITMFQGLPKKGGKVIRAAEGLDRGKVFYRVYGVPKELVDKTYRTKGEKLTDADRAKIDAHLAGIRAEAEALGVAPRQIVLEISDEPGVRRAEIFGDVCRHLRKASPDMLIYVNPCFWTGKGFSPADEIIECLSGFYPTHVDVSVPYRSLVEDRECRQALWTGERTVNAQYAHPAHRAGRSIAWSSFRYGLDGFAYWAYYSPRGNPWDIRTWKYWSYECQLVFPLEKTLAITPVYEEMREAAEDWRMLQLLKQSGRTGELERLMAEFASGFDEARKETARPYNCDFRRLREKALRLAAGMR
jgi:hypothetical protein